MRERLLICEPRKTLLLKISRKSVAPIFWSPRESVPKCNRWRLRQKKLVKISFKLITIRFQGLKKSLEVPNKTNKKNMIKVKSMKKGCYLMKCSRGIQKARVVNRVLIKIMSRSVGLLTYWVLILQTVITQTRHQFVVKWTFEFVYHNKPQQFLTSKLMRSRVK